MVKFSQLKGVNLLTVKELKESIRKFTGEINSRIATAYAENMVTPQIDKIINKLQKYGGKPSIANKSRDYIGLGFRGKKKGGEFGLEAQYKELSRYLLNDVWTPEGMKAQSEQYQKIYEKFINNQKVDWTYEKWRDFVNFMDNASSEILNAFGYEKTSNHRGSKSAEISEKNTDILSIYEAAYENKNINLNDLMQKVYEELPEGGDQDTALEMLKQAIKENMS